MNALFEFCLRMGDNTLILGHRLSEWCGHAPALEEDIALANTALDLIGQTQLWLGLAGEIEGAGRDADQLAFHRDVFDFRNVLLVEQPNRDFGNTILRQFLFDAMHVPLLSAVTNSNDERVAEIAEKALKEASYHLERSGDIVIALGDGTEESHKRMQAALDRLWSYAGEIFEPDGVDLTLAETGIAPDPSSLKPAWEHTVIQTLQEASLAPPDTTYTRTGGRDGR